MIYTLGSTKTWKYREIWAEWYAGTFQQVSTNLSMYLSSIHLSIYQPICECTYLSVCCVLNIDSFSVIKYSINWSRLEIYTYIEGLYENKSNAIIMSNCCVTMVLNYVYILYQLCI